MRIYYVGECRSRNLYVATALGVDAEHWSYLAERVQDWRRVLEDEYHVPTGQTLRGDELLSPRGTPFPRGRRDPLPTLEEGLEIMMRGLRVLEHSQNSGGAIGVNNVCRRNSPFRRHRHCDRAAARGRLLELADVSLAADGRYGHFIEDKGLPVLALAAGRCAGEGDTTVCAPPHRRTGDDELLQLAGLVSYALLQQEEPTAMSEALNFHLAFGILNRVLDRRVGPDDHQGVARL